MLADDEFEAYYRQHREGLVRYINVRVRDRTSAQDLVQDVYTKAYRHRDRFDESRSFTAWIYTIARNSCIDHLRRRVRDPLSAVAPNAPVSPPDLDSLAESTPHDPSVAAERDDLVLAVRAELERLPEQRRAAVEMRVVEGLTYRETSEALGVPLGTVAYWVRESIETIAERLKHLH